MTPFEHLSAKLAHAQLIDADAVRVDIEELASVLAGYEKARAEAIDEFVTFANTMPTIEEDDGYIRPMRLEEMAERLKEKKDAK